MNYTRSVSHDLSQKKHKTNTGIRHIIVCVICVLGFVQGMLHSFVGITVSWLGVSGQHAFNIQDKRVMDK
jgi:hypothetical protein